MFWTIPNALGPRGIKALQQFGKTHHDDEGHKIRDKHLDFRVIAEILSDPLSRILPFVFHSVDPMMLVYRLDSTAPHVAPHMDENFDGPEGTRARYSVLVKLNDDYRGGDTVFCGNIVAHMKPGDAVVFPHDLLHEARAVESGVKYMLKTDIFVMSPQ